CPASPQRPLGDVPHRDWGERARDVVVGTRTRFFQCGADAPHVHGRDARRDPPLLHTPTQMVPPARRTWPKVLVQLPGGPELPWPPPCPGPLSPPACWSPRPWPGLLWP